MKITFTNIKRAVGFCAALMMLTAINAQNAHADNPSVQITSQLSHSYIMTGQNQKVYLKVGLRGTKPDSVKMQRPPINLALVLDKSGSMSGQKIEDVKQAAKAMIDRLQSGDTISIVIYDDRSQVLVPTTHLENAELIRQRIDSITANGGTALYDGVTDGAHELMNYVSDNQINRVILLSDGLANVGPQSTEELGRLGLDLIQQGISVSTIGIGEGYNEDLMSTLAAKSDGFHRFLANTADLYSTLDWEMGKISSAVANDVTVKLKFARGVRPLSVGREGVINGQEVTVKINQVYSDHEIYVLTEAEIMPDIGQHIVSPIADVNLLYFDMASKNNIDNWQYVSTKVTNDQNLVNTTLNRDVLIAVNEQNAAAIQKTAIDLRDQGKVHDAKALLDEMAETLKKAGELLASPRLTKYSEAIEDSAQKIEDDAQWNENRKQNTSTMFSVSFNVT